MQCTPNYAPIEPPPSYEASLEGSVSRLDPIVEETSFMMGNSVEDDNGQAATTADNGEKKAFLIASLIVIAIFVLIFYEQIKEHDKFDTRVNPMTPDDHPGWETTTMMAYLIASFMFGVLIMVSWFIYEQINYAARSGFFLPVDDEHD